MNFQRGGNSVPEAHQKQWQWFGIKLYTMLQHWFGEKCVSQEGIKSFATIRNIGFFKVVPYWYFLNHLHLHHLIRHIRNIRKAWRRRHLLIQSQQWSNRYSKSTMKQQNNAWNLFEAKKKGARTTPLTITIKIVNFDQFSHIVLLFLLSSLNK